MAWENDENDGNKETPGRDAWGNPTPRDIHGNTPKDPWGNPENRDAWGNPPKDNWGNPLNE